MPDHRPRKIVQGVLERLQVQPEELFAHSPGQVRDPAVILDQLTPDLFRPLRGGFTPLSWLWRINAETLDRKLRDELDPLQVGYCYMICRKGALIHGSASLFAQLPQRGQEPDDGNVPWGYDVPMNICSISKFVTAVAVFKLLRERGLTPQTGIGDYLPQYWKASDNVRALTFHDLLRHEAGLGGQYEDSGAGNFAAAKETVQNDTTGSGTFAYRNANYAILRTTFATLSNILPMDFLITKLELSGFGVAVQDDEAATDAFWDLVSLQAYNRFVNDRLFAPANIQARAFEPADSAAKGYEAKPKAPGVRLEDVAADAGSSGWHLTVRELGRLLHAVRRGGSIVSAGNAQRLMVARYGLDAIDETKAGAVYRKNGRFELGSKGMDTAMYCMPGALELAVFVNALPARPIAQPLRGPPVRPTYLAAIPRLIAESAELRLF